MQVRKLNHQEAIFFEALTKDRIENMKLFIPSNPSEKRIKDETEEWLEFIEKMLEEEIKKYE